MDLDRFDRQLRLFGREGQARIADTYAVVVGCGGTGSHVVQQLAFLGVRMFGLLDADHATRSSRNRLIGMVPADVTRQTTKVAIAARTIRQIEPNATITEVHDSFVSEAGERELAKATVIFGCVDRDGARLLLNEYACAYDKPYFDLATDTEGTLGQVRFGGRVTVRTDRHGCLFCTDALDKEAVRRDLTTPERREEEAQMYGIRRDAFTETGPSVVMLNGVIASLAVTEFMVFSTGLPRPPKRSLRYDGTRGIVNEPRDTPAADCLYCTQTGQNDRGDWQRHIRAGLGRWVR